MKSQESKEYAGTGSVVSDDLFCYPSDTDMLNWLDAQGECYEWKVQLPSDYPNMRECVFVSRNTMRGHKTIRDAIADRMKKQNTD